MNQREATRPSKAAYRQLAVMLLLQLTVIILLFVFAASPVSLHGPGF